MTMICSDNVNSINNNRHIFKESVHVRAENYDCCCTNVKKHCKHFRSQWRNSLGRYFLLLLSKQPSGLLGGNSRSFVSFEVSETEGTRGWGTPWMSWSDSSFQREISNKNLLLYIIYWYDILNSFNLSLWLL